MSSLKTDMRLSTWICTHLHAAWTATYRTHPNLNHNPNPNFTNPNLHYSGPCYSRPSP